MNRLRIEWSIKARADLRAIDRHIALDILICIDRYLLDRSGDVKKLQPPLTGLRLRCGDFRVFFRAIGDVGIAVREISNRRDAYRRQ